MGLAPFSCECATQCDMSSGSATPHGGGALIGAGATASVQASLLPSLYLQTLTDLLPPGRAWTRDSDAQLTALLTALSYEPGRIGANTDQLLDEADPSTATEMLPDWLRVTGLAGDTTLTTPAMQRAAIVAKLVSGGGASIPFIEQLALSLGYTVTISENMDPFVANSNCNQSLYQYPWNYAWTVTTAHGAMDAFLQTLIGGLSPAHTFVNFVFT